MCSCPMFLSADPYVPAYSPKCSCPLSYIFLFAVNIPVRCPIHIFASDVLHVPVHRPTCSRPLSYIIRPLSNIFLFAVYIPVRCPIHIFQPAALYFPVRCPSFSRPLSYIFQSAVLGVSVRCPIYRVAAIFPEHFQSFAIALLITFFTDSFAPNHLGCLLNHK